MKQHIMPQKIAVLYNLVYITVNTYLAVNSVCSEVIRKQLFQIFYEIRYICNL